MTGEPYDWAELAPDDPHPAAHDRCPDCGTVWDGNECPTCLLTAKDVADREARGVGREYR